MNSSISRWLSSRGRGATLVDLAMRVERHLALRQVEIERAARGAGREQGAEGGVEGGAGGQDIVGRAP